ncbi:iron(III) ABC transporter-permease protein [Azotobacter vinelandii CA]|uniref:Iron(III) ABC transporter-permease protein n=2 Tax=Azotobacter vinelandii TaxID=354 RepID=C1DJQ1_AZOVD|nr:iron ABC transporter permease [Azotobacter vinelandii]ACO78820.1 iron(III) ABC transporter-permease protein [Azotobacter vinelandii DJ]AGK14891.1 iron(III) ABC transporter-permease protein [Azotobacter vinelandii CA]AGK20774.1 iron(III) ABC transporter-permease protein [Azotobacter vinelandii CA6]WKN19826.1 iron ABC transporter permease [Azotobacter vinelandii]SFX31964.1 iron complex transport system permease protein [Azotobacter vinelandii]
MRLIGLGALLLMLVLVSFGIGRYPVSPDTVLAILAGKLFSIDPFWTPETEAVVMGIRLPRILAALLVGAALSVSGAAYQGLFRNPMVSPGILGVSAGASLGAALAILLGHGMPGIQGLAFAGGLAAVGATWAIGVTIGRQGDPVLVMVLAGIVIGTLFTALVSLVKFVADPYNTLPAITFWLMGSLASVDLPDLSIAALPILAGLAGLLAMSWTLNVLCFGDEEARALGLETGRLRFVVILCATLVSAAAVAIAGIIGLVGLIVPHLARMLVGPDHRVLLPVSTLLGAGFLLAVDDLARSLFEVEVPLGIVTSIIGAPFFLYLMNRSRKAWI